MEFTKIKERSGMTLPQLSEYFEIPHRTLVGWANGSRKCPEYLLKLMLYKLEKENIGK